MSRDPISADYQIQTVADVEDILDSYYDLPIDFTVPEMAGFTLRHVPPSLRSIDAIIDFIRETAQGAICTHRLIQRGPTYFYGAELAAALYDAKIPTLVVTQYTAIDFNGPLRKRTSMIILIPTVSAWIMSPSVSLLPTCLRRRNSNSTSQVFPIMESSTKQCCQSATSAFTIPMGLPRNCTRYPNVRTAIQL
jgi:hypothetical protein